MITCDLFFFGGGGFGGGGGGVSFSEDYTDNDIFQSLAELILQSCNTSCGKPSDYNCISEFQEELTLQKVHCNCSLSGLQIIIISVLTVS